MPDTRHNWPRFKSPLLEAVAGAFTKRRKAIRYHTESFEIELEIEDSGFEPRERFNANAATLSDRPARLRLSVWPDGALWLWAGRPAKQGWQFSISFHGFMAEAAPAGVVSKFEESLGVVYGATCVDDCRQPLLFVWRDVDPQVERAV